MFLQRRWFTQKDKLLGTEGELEWVSIFDGSGGVEVVHLKIIKNVRFLNISDFWKVVWIRLVQIRFLVFFLAY